MAERSNPRWVKELDVYQLPKGLIRLCLLAVVGGVLIGVLGSAFRWAIFHADRFRFELINWAHQWPGIGVLIPIVAAAIAVAIARYTTRLVPETAGGGVSRVEASLRGEMRLESLRIIPGKFIGGVLAIGSGLALQREGPTVQMGASIGSKLGRMFKQPRDAEELAAGLAGAGLGVAFNAPLGGAMFVFEELSRAYRLRLVLTTLIGGATAVTVSRELLGDHAFFYLGYVDPVRMKQLVAFAIFGLMMGALGAAYNKTIIWFLDMMLRFRRFPPEVKAAFIGGMVGAIAYFYPTMVGGGEPLTQRMLTDAPLPSVILLILLFRWVLGPLSISVGAPGGLFTPMLAIGAASGALVSSVVNQIAPWMELSVTSFAFVGMAAVFAGSLRSPLTGVVLTAEMAASTALLMPALIASAGAVLAATLLRNEPLFDTLAPRAAGWIGPPRESAGPPDST